MCGSPVKPQVAPLHCPILSLKESFMLTLFNSRSETSKLESALAMEKMVRRVAARLFFIVFVSTERQNCE